MSRLFIRDRSIGYITFISCKKDLQDFIDCYIPGRRFILGDLATFNKPMKQMLLKFIEECPIIDCYSSQDLGDSILQSRFISISKEPLYLNQQHNVDEFKVSDRSYQSSVLYLGGLNSDYKLRAVGVRNQILRLLLR